ncbi:7,8-didemethyl-8-hydroxy-5-deazariboflavin synthase subunit CofG [Synechocystis sp. LKSZ1]|uniref:7,8-didemethyl-8-hydroxy-5-deazariboflavin synthase subunit CofG n=1 Tax=Synechocystis sp. LKSZ1 TaxID=3144951 RepID=UPI00336BEC49
MIPITYSPAYTLVPTYECFNRCEYCNFRVDPGQGAWLTLTAAQEILQSLQGQGITEILILSGEVHPQSPERPAWFQRIYDLCQLSLDLGFFPHTNAGPLHQQEMAQFKTVNVSLGLMLEQVTPTLLTSVHRQAPSKKPARRRQQLQWAGELQIPFTTGLLLGIGEQESDWWDSLQAIAELHQHYGHIQEVILQPHSPGPQQTWQASPFPLAALPDLVARARQILPADITIQIPPNLITDLPLLLQCLQAGARDLGGLSPMDEVNPSYPHLPLAQLTLYLAQAGWQLQPRLPLYPHHDAWLTPSLRQRVQAWRQRDVSNGGMQQ